MQLYKFIFEHYCIIYLAELKLTLCLGEREGKLLLKKNLAKERMQKIRSLIIDKEKFKEMYSADVISKRTSQKFTRSLSSSSMYIKFYAYDSFEIFVEIF